VPDRLTSLDATFLNFERPTAPLHVAGLYIFEGTPELEGRPGLAGIFKAIEERLAEVPRYRQRLAGVPLGLGHPLWIEDPDFDLSYHLRRAALPSPGGRKELLEYVARLHARPLDRTRPLWEVYVIEGLADGRMALYSKVHHAMVDGISGIDLVTILFDFEAKGRTPRRKGRRLPEAPPSRAELLAGTALDFAGDIVSTVRKTVTDPRALLVNAAGAVAMRTLAQLFRPAPEGPLNVPVGAHRRIELAAISLDRAKAIKDRWSGTVNDVVLTAVAEAVHHFLKQRGAARPGLVYRVMVPVSVRDPSQRMTLGNRVTAIFADLPVGPMTPRQRFLSVHREMAGLKESHQALAADRLIAITSWAPATLHVLAGRLSLSGQRFINLVVSNVPGVQAPLYVGGARLLEAYPLLPLAGNLALVICVSSYNGSLYWGLIGDRDGLPDLEKLREGLELGFDRLERAAGIRRSRKAARGRASSA